MASPPTASGALPAGSWTATTHGTPSPPSTSHTCPPSPRRSGGEPMGGSARLHARQWPGDDSARADAPREERGAAAANWERGQTLRTHTTPSTPTGLDVFVLILPFIPGP